MFNVGVHVCHSYSNAIDPDIALLIHTVLYCFYVLGEHCMARYNVENKLPPGHFSAVIP